MDDKGQFRLNKKEEQLLVLKKMRFLCVKRENLTVYLV